MAITTEAPVLALTNELTYEAYMAEPEVRGRYDIVHGVRVFQPPVSWRRQRIIGHLSSAVFVRKRTHGDHSVLCSSGVSRCKSVSRTCCSSATNA